MARPINKLSAAEVKAATYGDRAYKVFDGAGLFLHVQASGRYWRLKYRWGGRERLLSLGVYPRVSLAKARERRDEARKLIDDGIDPSARRKAEKAARNKPTRFEAVAREWLQKQTTLAPGTRTVTLRRWERWVFPHIGSTPIDRLEPADVLHVLRRIEAAGKHETAHRMRQRIGQVCRFAVASGRADRDPTGDLKDALAPVPRRNRAAITEPDAFGGLLRAMDGYDGQPSTKAALHLLALTFVRPGELRFAAWPEFDLEGAIWRIPGSRMKMGREHIVPLAPEAIEHLRRLHPVTGHRPYVFEGNRPGRPISENTVNMALKTMGYSADQATAHGFRSTASTLLHEMGWPPEVIELQLSHAQRSQVAAAYNRSARLEERQKMMLAWAEYLDKLRREVKAPA